MSLRTQWEPLRKRESPRGDTADFKWREYYRMATKMKTPNKPWTISNLSSFYHVLTSCNHLKEKYWVLQAKKFIFDHGRKEGYSHHRISYFINKTTQYMSLKLALGEREWNDSRNFRKSASIDVQPYADFYMETERYFFRHYDDLSPRKRFKNEHSWIQLLP